MEKHERGHKVERDCSVIDGIRQQRQCDVWLGARGGSQLQSLTAKMTKRVALGTRYICALCV